MNKVVLIGRLTRDPEMKYTPGNGTAVTTFTLAIDRRFSKDGQREADFINVVAWGKTAELTAQYVTKGRQLGVSGRIQTRTYDAKDGTKRYVTEVVAEEVQFLDSKGSRNDKSEGYSFNGGGDNFTNNNFGSEDVTPVDDGDIPF